MTHQEAILTRQIPFRQQSSDETDRELMRERGKLLRANARGEYAELYFALQSKERGPYRTLQTFSTLKAAQLNYEAAVARFPSARWRLRQVQTIVEHVPPPKLVNVLNDQ